MAKKEKVESVPAEQQADRNDEYLGTDVGADAGTNNSGTPQPEVHGAEEIKGIRKFLKLQMMNVDQLGRSRALTHAYDKLELARMWLGKCLSKNGKTPYVRAEDLSSNLVDPPTDLPSDGQEQELIASMAELNPIRQLKVMRHNLDSVIDAVEPIMTYQSNMAFVYLQEARMYLGVELADRGIMFNEKEEN